MNVDRWVRQLTLLAMLLVALALLVMAVTLYAPRAQVSPPVQTSSRESEHPDGFSPAQVQGHET